MQLHCAVAIGSGRLSSFRAPLLQCTWWVVVGLVTTSRPARHFNLDNPGAYKVPAYATLKRFAMKKYLPRLAVAAAALLSIGAAQAVVIDFDHPIDSTFAAFAPLLGHSDEIQTQGFSLDTYSTKSGALAGDLVGALVDGSDLASTCQGLVCPSNNTSRFLAVLNDGVPALGRLDGAAFKVTQLDASFIAASGDVVLPTALLLRAVGYSGNTQKYQQDWYLPGPVSGAYSFSTYALSAANAAIDITELDFYGYACTTTTSCSRSLDKGQFALDNINAVPEPSEWLLMGLGLVAVAAVVRRRSAA